ITLPVLSVTPRGGDGRGRRADQSAGRCRDGCLGRSRRRCSGGTLSSRHCLALATELHSSRPDPMGHAIGKIQSAALDSLWQELFDSHDLVHNWRRTLRVVVSEQGDGGFAVVDVDTLWRSRRTQEPLHWKGRACKVYTKVDGLWLFLFQTGLLEY